MSQMSQRLICHFVQIRLLSLHVSGKTNLADMFTKEMKDSAKFIILRDFVVKDTPTDIHSETNSQEIEAGGGVLETSDRP